MKSFKQYFLEQAEDSVAIFPGGFKPPTKGHFNAFNYILQRAKRGIVYIGNQTRNNVTPEMSKAIWDIYSKYIPKPIEVIISADTPITSTYKFAEKNPNINIYVGKGIKDLDDTRFNSFEKNKEKYPLVDVITIKEQAGGISGTITRQKLQVDIDDALEYFLPDIIKENNPKLVGSDVEEENKRNVLRIKNILLNK